MRPPVEDGYCRIAANAAAERRDENRELGKHPAHHAILAEEVMVHDGGDMREEQ
jgi:hypothetical protein